MPITVQIPTALRRHTAGVSSITCAASNLGELFSVLDEKFPELKPHLRDDKGQVRRFLNIYVNEEDIRFLGGQTYALAPFVWLNINVERNLCVLLNQIQQEREVYSRLVRDKEVATRDEMRAFLVPFGFDLKWGKVGNFGP